jgi:hypothetical protein
LALELRIMGDTFIAVVGIVGPIAVLVVILLLAL